MPAAGQQKIDSRFADKREQLKTQFAAAYEFLCYPENNPQSGLWLSTATNAHLYRGGSFLARVELEPLRLSFSPRYRNIFHQDTTDHSSLLFPGPFRMLVREHKGFEQRWAQEGEGRDEYFYIKATAPSSFFNALLDLVQNLKLPTH